MKRTLRLKWKIGFNDDYGAINISPQYVGGKGVVKTKKSKNTR